MFCESHVIGSRSKGRRCLSLSDFMIIIQVLGVLAVCLPLSLSLSLSLDYNYDKDLKSPLPQSLRVDISLSLFISPYFSLPLYACLCVWIFLWKNGTIIQRSFTNICYSIYSKALHHTFFSLPVTLSHSLFQKHL